MTNGAGVAEWVDAMGCSSSEPSRKPLADN